MLTFLRILQNWHNKTFRVSIEVGQVEKKGTMYHFTPNENGRKLFGIKKAKYFNKQDMRYRLENFKK